MNGIPDNQKSGFAQDANQHIGIKRECTKCGKEKRLVEFKPKKRGLYGRCSWCKSCRRTYENNRNKAKPERCREQSRKWRINNPAGEKAKAKRNKLKILSTPGGILNHRISSYIRSSLKTGKQGRPWESLVGYTVTDLKSHIERHFLPGMSWENASEWHIDHIIPRSAFNYETPDDLDFKRCWALKNLSPLWKFDNLSKRNRVDRPFQPSLNIAV